MPPERRAVLLLLGLAVLGQWLRGRAITPEGPPGEARLISGGPPGSPHAHRDSSVAVNQPLAVGETIDLDRAGVAEVARLPRVGLTLARTIVADRDAHGPFGSLEGLDRVPGVGAGLLAAIGKQVRFSAAGRIGGTLGSPSPPLRVGIEGGSSVDRPAESPSRRAAESPNRGASQPVHLNTATAAELEQLPFLGPYMAGQIVVFRDRHGPFAAVDSLVRVPGIGPATLAKVRERLTVE
ncbi:MAG: helix-hairpin-helix domain-containing protein [bacterium]